jgi:GNAT superfamily N-acetyltransferase
MSALTEHATVSIGFTVESVFDVAPVDGGLGGFQLTERPVEPYIKDYDTADGEGPTRWATRFDVSNWGLISAHRGGVRLGGAVIAWNSPELYMIKSAHQAALWDLRVAPDARGEGVGSRLFAAAADWARERGCTRMSIETQNVNVCACRFYASMGCSLGQIDRFAYPDLRDEVMLNWSKDL